MLMMVCTLLIGAAYLLGVNLDAMVEYIGDQNETIVYMNLDATEEQIAAADSAIRSTPHVVGVTYVSPQEVLSIYDDALQDVIDLESAFADDNPFYPNYRVVVDSPDNIEAVSQQLQQIDGVDDVRAPLELSEVFVSLQKAVSYACYAVVAVLAVVSIVVINNTIKITVFNRRKEIGIMKLVGATNGFIRFPFFVEGVTSGLISAAIASGVVCGATMPVAAGMPKIPATFPRCWAANWCRCRTCGTISWAASRYWALCCAASAQPPASANI